MEILPGCGDLEAAGQFLYFTEKITIFDNDSCFMLTFAIIFQKITILSSCMHPVRKILLPLLTLSKEKTRRGLTLWMLMERIYKKNQTKYYLYICCILYR